MAKVIPHVVAAERQHSHRITADLANCSDRRRCHFRSHCRANVNSMDPVESLKDQRHRRGTATAEKDTCDRYSRRMINIRIQGWILFRWRAKPTVRVGPLFSTLPLLAFTFDQS